MTTHPDGADRRRHRRDAHAGLSAYGAVCLVGAAEEAGIEDEALDRVLVEHVPGFVPP